MLSITNLSVSVADHQVLKGLSLDIKPGEVHAIMGPNGSGKSTLTKALGGHPAYTVTGGSVSFLCTDLLSLTPEARCHAGLFISLQYPVDVPGVLNSDFLRLAYNAKRKATGQAEVSMKDFAPILATKLDEAQVPPDFADRQLNHGMSGGQKKRNELLQMHVLEPRLAILDETDSGVDIDALKAVGGSINAFRRADRAVVLITHYQRLLDLVRPDQVHVLAAGKVQRSGGPELAHQVELEGYDWIDRT